MPVHILVTGPIRPSLQCVLNAHSQLKRYFPSCVTHLVYWATTASDHEILTKTFDHVIAYPEPTNSFIDSIVSGRNIQVRLAPDKYKERPYNTYKQTNAIQLAILHSKLADSDIVVRFRTDGYLFNVDTAALASFIEAIEPGVYYTIPRPGSSANGVCDMFSISRFDVFKKVWSVSGDMYNRICENSYNPENAVKNVMQTRSIKSGDIPSSIVNFAVCRRFDGLCQLDIFS